MLNEQELGEFIDTRFTSTLFRLETLDRYDVSSEIDDYRRYVAGQPGPLNKQAWMDMIRSEVARDLHTYRVHVVRSPLTDYLRYEFEWGYSRNAEAGEHIRIIDTAEQRKPDVVPDHDWWLIGDEHLVLMHYNPDGTFQSASIGAPELIPRYVAARNAAWAAGIDFTDYWRRHPQYHRDRSAA
ncbi:hypothetical protein F0L68_39770 [Solihabitans fulvus]|uniref:DUF6879 domain-containing protein n=1 Tax=Solihabitans fulvus TaxID=1892852 RepID=A0A5B2WD92_9PSEU|nr:DUF6879 family protein [Solihabitans fulvus]KAA2248690.1 hypothetical protein F0L68_39770 [Solihabitans fulvus]